MSGGDYDFDRYSQAVLGLDRLARQRIWPYGCWLWRRLDPAQRRGLSRRELLLLLGMGMCAQSILSLLWLCEVIESGSEVDDLTRATLVSVTEADANSVLFARLIVATGLRPYRIPVWVRLAARLASWLPAGRAHRRMRPLLEEYTALRAREAGRPPTSALRLLTGVRHLAATREDLVESAKLPGPLVNSLRRWALSAATAAAQAMVTHPAVYRTAGLGE
ncbi:hypothetical protein ABIA39_003015 [Nocardia sp. GAS34]|uniref:hypothetical protein n=1 Tax=unclassified Nocardia TaxID=2637762 RepID=UPI003D1FF5A2